MASWDDNENRETRWPVSTFGGSAKPVTAGQLTLDGQELRPLTNIERRFWNPCCSEALVETPANCVCAFVTRCAEHGRRHNGTHD